MMLSETEKNPPPGGYIKNFFAEESRDEITRGIADSAVTMADM
jgi:hypothetical protein